MREWQDATIERIEALEPAKVLELGVGSGLILSRIAPFCDEYWGVDLSPRAVANLEHLLADEPWADRVHLAAQAAHQIEDLPEGYFDTVIVNSVAQYFPSVAYLVEVLQAVRRRLAPGGTVFVGDVRNHRTFELFRAAVEIGRARPGAAPEAVRRSVAEAIDRESELLLDPDFFTVLDGFAAVDVLAKNGTADNELTRHRYDVVLYTAAPAVKSREIPVQQWDSAGLDGVELVGEGLRLIGIPFARLAGEIAAQAALGPEP